MSSMAGLPSDTLSSQFYNGWPLSQSGLSDHLNIVGQHMGPVIRGYGSLGVSQPPECDKSGPKSLRTRVGPGRQCLGVKHCIGMKVCLV